MPPLEKCEQPDWKHSQAMLQNDICPQNSPEGGRVSPPGPRTKYSSVVNIKFPRATYHTIVPPTEELFYLIVSHYSVTIRRQLMRDFEQFTRRMPLQYIIHGENSDPRPFNVKSDWIPPIQPSVTLQSYLEEIKISMRIFKCADQKIICHTDTMNTSDTIARNHSPL